MSGISFFQEKKLVLNLGRPDHDRFMVLNSSSALDVAYVAELARLRLSPEEAATFQKQLGDVLGYVDLLKEVDVSQVSLLGETELKNHLRSDLLQPSLTAAEALANAPAQENNLFLVPRIIE